MLSIRSSPATTAPSNPDLTSNSPITNTNSIIGGDAKLAPLGFYGGTTQTHALFPGSSAINAGNDCVLTANGCGNNNPALPTDQRGASRVGPVDIGAFEAPASLVVTNTLNSGAGSLRDAIATANADPLYDAITFDIPSTDTGCTNGVCTITLTSGELSIAANSALVINGTGANRLIVSGNNQRSVCSFQSECQRDDQRSDDQRRQWRRIRSWLRRRHLQQQLHD